MISWQIVQQNFYRHSLNDLELPMTGWLARIRTTETPDNVYYDIYSGVVCVRSGH